MMQLYCTCEDVDGARPYVAGAKKPPAPGAGVAAQSTNDGVATVFLLSLDLC